MAFNYSTTWIDESEFLNTIDSTSSYTTTQSPIITPSPTKRKKRPKSRATPSPTNVIFNEFNFTFDSTWLFSSGDGSLSTPSPTRGSKGSKGRTSTTRSTTRNINRNGNRTRAGNRTSTTRSSTTKLRSTRFNTRTSKTGSGAKGAFSNGAKAIDYEQLELKQVLVVSSLILISFVIIGIIYSFIKKKSRNQIKVQWQAATGRLFFSSLIIALCAFFANSITMTYFVFNLDDMTSNQRPWLFSFGKIPYLIGRLIVESFFSLRLHLIFGKTAHSIPKWVILSLLILSFISFILGFIAGLGSRSVYNWFNWDPQIDTGTRLVSTLQFYNESSTSIKLSFAGDVISSFVSFMVMYLYIRILYKINVQTGEATVEPTSTRTELFSMSTSMEVELQRMQAGEIETGQSRFSVVSTSTNMNTPRSPHTPITPTSPNSPRSPSSVDSMNEGQRTRWKMSFSKSPKSPKESMSVTLEENQLKLLRNITKNTLLGLIGLSSTIVINIRVLVTFITNTRTDAGLWRCMWSFDGAINIVVIYLIFAWTTRQYNKLCYVCHKGVKQCCVRATKYSILKKAEKEMSEYME